MIKRPRIFKGIGCERTSWLCGQNMYDAKSIEKVERKRNSFSARNNQLNKRNEAAISAQRKKQISNSGARNTKTRLPTSEINSNEMQREFRHRTKAHSCDGSYMMAGLWEHTPIYSPLCSPWFSPPPSSAPPASSPIWTATWDHGCPSSSHFE